jgi:hypothetical protein
VEDFGSEVLKSWEKIRNRCLDLEGRASALVAKAKNRKFGVEIFQTMLRRKRKDFRIDDLSREWQKI